MRYHSVGSVAASSVGVNCETELARTALGLEEATTGMVKCTINAILVAQKNVVGIVSVSIMSEVNSCKLKHYNTTQC